MRQENDAAHRIAVKILRLIATLLREEEQHEFYREAMPMIVAEIKEYDRKRRIEASRLGRQQETEPPCC